MEFVERLAAAVRELAQQHARVLVGIDGPDAAGKTTLADRLTAELPVTVVRASIDEFHHPREVRQRRGTLSAEGYYRDSFDHGALLDRCLRPFAAGADRIRTAIFDHRTDQARVEWATAVPARAVLIFDGVFLLRPELRDHWTLTAYLRVSEPEILRRAIRRDAALFGGSAEVEHRYRARYLPGQARYRAEADPEGTAHLLIDNERPDRPRVVRWLPPSSLGG